MVSIENALIKAAYLEVEDHGCLTCRIELEGNGWQCSFGGFNLCGNTNTEGKDYTGFYIRRLIEVFFDGYGRFSSLPGIYCRVKLEDRQVVAIGHILKDNWFEPRVELKNR